MKSAFLPLGLVVALSSGAFAAEKKPVLLVIANHHFHYKEYNDTRKALEAAGYTVEIGAGEVKACDPHRGTGEGADGGWVTPDIAISKADPARYSAIAFAGGWGASQYQPNFPGTYFDRSYNGTPEARAAANKLINAMLKSNKVVGGLCHGVTVLAWASVDGKSPIDGRKVVGYAGGGPGCVVGDKKYGDGQIPSRMAIEANGGTVGPPSSVGDPRTAADDVWVDGLIVTGENEQSAYLFGQTIARELNKKG